MKHKKKHRHRMIKTRGGWTACGVCGEEKAMKRRGRIKQRPAYPDGVLVPVKEFKALERDKRRLDWLEKAIQGRILLYDIWVRPSETPFKNLRGVIDAEIERILVGAAIKREGR